MGLCIEFLPAIQLPTDSFSSLHLFNDVDLDDQGYGLTDNLA